MRFAAAYGISRYGGDVSFETRIARVPAPEAPPSSFHDVSFTVVLKGQRTIDAWAFWCAEQTTQFLSGVNLDQLDDKNKSSLKALQTLNLKLSQSKLNPRWEPVKVSALVGVRPVPALTADKDSAPEGVPPPPIYTLAADGQLVEATGPAAGSLAELVGKQAIIKGVVKTPGVIELASAQPVKEHTLELVIMSQCPFGSRAADAVIEYLKSPVARGTDGSTPELSIRYLFYERRVSPEQPATSRWWSLHGDAEIAENLVQMTIRDLFTPRFRDYLQARAREPSAAWQTIAGQVGLTPSDITSIDEYIVASKDALIAAEHEYVQRTLGVSDGSPTFIWESQQVGVLSSVPEFSTLDLNKGSCAGAAGHP